MGCLWPIATYCVTERHQHWLLSRSGFQGCSVEAGSGAESTRLCVVGISVELATPRITEILMSQLGFRNGDARLVRDIESETPACGYR
jgi:hypothetical protein